MSDLPSTDRLIFDDVEVIEEPVAEFEFNGFQVQHTNKGWFLITYDELEEEGEVVVPIETEDAPFTEDAEILLAERYGISFSQIDLDHLKSFLLLQ